MSSAFIDGLVDALEYAALCLEREDAGGTLPTSLRRFAQAVPARLAAADEVAAGLRRIEADHISYALAEPFCEWCNTVVPEHADDCPFAALRAYEATKEAELAQYTAGKTPRPASGCLCGDNEQVIVYRRYHGIDNCQTGGWFVECASCHISVAGPFDTESEARAARGEEAE